MNKYDLLVKLNISIFSIYGEAYIFKRRLMNGRHDRRYMKRNRKLKETKHGKRCYVIGLGPSLNKVDLSKIKDDVFVVNDFFKYEKGMDDPNYYCLVDNEYFESEEWLEEIKAVYERYPNTIFFMNGKYADVVKKVVSTKRISFLYSGRGIFSHKKEIDMTGYTGIALNVVSTAIMQALYMGYSEIVLLGCDFTFHFTPEEPAHCYDNEPSGLTRTFGPTDYLSASFALYVHGELKKYAKEHGAKIYNATEGSLLNTYERISFEDSLTHKVIS